ncbi:MAG: HAMP domain-containing histidine kinase [Candidatus Gastranaerophilales bacterium]|nr:HAMP domain-containing histidine kinase [Candidatus Gastranaerophilales bacterium]
MEKTIEKARLIVDENEKVIANILHDIKSPLYSIKIGLQNKLDSELNKDIFETTLDIIKYIENFLVNYSFKDGKFENKIALCDVKKIINQKIENYKYIFINKNIHIDMILDDDNYKTNSIEIFLSSIIGNIISNMAFHASNNENAIIELYKKDNCIIAEFRNYYNEKNNNFNLGLDFCRELAMLTKINLKFCKTKNTVVVKLKIPTLNNKNLKGRIVNV